jgi:type 1 glutamine amidotransferase
MKTNLLRMMTLMIFVSIVVGCSQKSKSTTFSSKVCCAKKTAKKILVIAGRDSHGWGAHAWFDGADVIKKCLDEDKRNNTEVVVSKLWPKDEKAFKGVSTIVILSDGGKRHPAYKHLDFTDKLMKKGVGMVCIHYAVEMEKGKSGDLLKSWIGGTFEIFWSVNPHWLGNFKNFKKHPSLNGVKPFSMQDEWYFNMRFVDKMKGITPILSDLPPAKAARNGNHAHNANIHAHEAVVKRKEEQHVAWAYDRPDGGRGFGITGAHYRKCWNENNFRKLVLNAILWTAKVKVPQDGVKSSDNPMSMVKVAKKK